MPAIAPIIYTGIVMGVILGPTLGAEVLPGASWQVLFHHFPFIGQYRQKSRQFDLNLGDRDLRQYFVSVCRLCGFSSSFSMT